MARIRFMHTVDLVIDYWHPAAVVGEGGVLRILGAGRIIDAVALREDPDAKIITDNPEAVCRVLGIAFPDEQVIQEGQEGETPEAATECDSHPLTPHAKRGG